MDVVSSRRWERFSASVDRVAPMKPRGLEEAPSPARLQVHFVYLAQHLIFNSSSTLDLYSYVSSGRETPTLIDQHEDPVRKVSCEFDLRVLLSREDELGANLSPFLSGFEITQGSEEHSKIVREVKRVGGEIGPERRNQGLFSLQVSILRVYTYDIL